jgi:hypothetical protein
MQQRDDRVMRSRQAGHRGRGLHQHNGATRGNARQKYESYLARAREAQVVTKDDLKEGLADIRKEMATKNDVAALDTKIGKLDLSIHRELEAIKQELKNVAGFDKEIDHALERIAAIEKHLGIEKKIAA